MCDYCHRFPHSPGCPNEPEPKKVTECCKCHRDVLDGDEIYVIKGETYCRYCIEESIEIAEAYDE